MATHRNNNDTKKAAGYFKEKFTIGLSRVTGDEVTRAIMKTTSHMLKAPNEKHLQRLLSATHGHFSESAQKEGVNMCRYIVEELEKRSHTHNWIVVLKTMLTFHAFLIDGSDDVNKVMQRNRNLFCSRGIKDLADSPDGAAQQRFITSYIRYLEERNITQMRIDLEVRIESSEYLSALKMMPMNVLAQALTQLIQQLECISCIEFREEIINNFATLEAHTRLINDGAHLYAFISDRMVYALEHFDELETKASKETWVVVYKRYAKCVQLLRALFEKMRKSRVAWGSVIIPQIKEFPEALLLKLEEELSSDGKKAAATSTPPPEVEDLNAVLAEEEKRQPQEEVSSVPATTTSRISGTGNTAAAASAAQVDLFGGPQQTPAPSEPVKPKLPDLDDLFGGVAPQQPVSQANANAGSTNFWGNQQPAVQAQPVQQNPIDIFAPPPQQQTAWAANPANNQFGYGSSSSGSAATPYSNNAASDIFGNVSNANQQQRPSPTPSGGQVPFHQQTATANMFGNNSADFAPIVNHDTVPNRFDPFAQPPRENVFVSNNNASNMFGNTNASSGGLAFVNNTNQSTAAAPKPRNDMDDLFGN